MDLERVKRYLEKGDKEEKNNGTATEELPLRFFEQFVMQNLQLDLIEHGRLICSMKIPPRLLNSGNFLHGGAIFTLVDLVGSTVIFSVGASRSGASVEIDVSFMDAAFADEEIEIEARVLRVGKTIGVVSVELRNKATGKIIAQGQYTKYIYFNSKM